MKLSRITPEAYTRITFAALIALVVIVITGGAVRLTGSGLGCPDWPACTSTRFFAPLEYHAVIEQVNRLFTGVVVVAVAAGVLGSLLRTPRRRDLTLWSLSLVIGVFAQAVLGGVSVWAGLDPRFVMAHFLLSQVIVWAAIVLHHRSKQPDAKPVAAVPRDYIWLGRAIAVVTSVVLFIGTLVTGTGPHAGDENVRRLAFNPHDITKIHGLAVWTLVFLTAFTLWRMSVAKVSPSVIRRGEVLMVALMVQGAIGYLQYSLGVPAALVVLHVAGATAVWSAAVVFNLAMFERWEDVGLGAFDGHEDDRDVFPKFSLDG